MNDYRRVIIGNCCWFQASFLEDFYNHAPVTSWHSLSHASFCRKMEGVRSIGVDKANPGGEAKNLYSDEEIGQLTDWRNEQNEDEALKAFTPECWQPWEWLSTLAKAHRDSSGNKLMQLAGLWADFSFVMANNASSKTAKSRVRQNKVLFDWRKLSDTSDAMSMHSEGQGETMQNTVKRKIPRGKTVSSKKRR
ncbi:hypothetical protein NX722_06580 [Endozoicomonas gorgoniicola]|uniref:Uncharacterized protein n=1 Tax=Endozoicomonas gorgoniicola TaxID=1234144 RepID=A0ABT3MSH2_9GAMM|nr:hypothetical protein [Endozoicomonas gorgoniicola]MCW7552318.1 hypothetical protein [Endozoicomonas gorgoniicola]